MGTVRVIIDGRELTVPKGRTVLEAALENAIDRARTEIAAELAHLQAYGALQQMMFNRPVAARNWLQASNPSERWKWDFLFQDLPPVKGALDPSSLPPEPPRVIQLRKID